VFYVTVIVSGHKKYDKRAYIAVIRGVVHTLLADIYRVLCATPAV